MEKDELRLLLERTSIGILPTRAGPMLANSAHLMFAELEQARMELTEDHGKETGRIVIGAMPLSRIYLLPETVARFRQRWPRMQLRILDGPCAEFVRGLRRGEIDFLIGALRVPPPIGDIVQLQLFEDSLTIVRAPATRSPAGEASPSINCGNFTGPWWPLERRRAPISTGCSQDAAKPCQRASSSRRLPLSCANF
jgi:DNA-binding transcriptional LysR family regulator